MNDTNKLHLFSDNEPLSVSRFDAMCSGLQLIEDMHWDTRDFVRANNLDSGIFLPGNVWELFCNLSSFKKWTYEMANICKVFSPFTGHYMVLWGRVDQDHLTSEMVNELYDRLYSAGIPENLDEVLEIEYGLIDRMLFYKKSLFKKYDKLVDSVPEWCRVPMPTSMGEIGICYRNTIVNYDTVTYQSRVNALFAYGVIDKLVEKTKKEGRVRVFEIGPGHCYMAYSLDYVLSQKAQFILVDLPNSLANGYVYLAGIFGPDEIEIVTKDTAEIGNKRFVLVANYLLPQVESYLGEIDLSINAISLNEMNLAQNQYYMDFIAAHSNSGAIFHMEGGGAYVDGHVDSLALAKETFPGCGSFPDKVIRGVHVESSPNNFFDIG